MQGIFKLDLCLVYNPIAPYSPLQNWRKEKRGRKNEMKCGQRQGGVLSELSSFVHFLTGIKIRIKEEGVKKLFIKLKKIRS